MKTHLVKDIQFLIPGKLYKVLTTDGSIYSPYVKHFPARKSIPGDEIVCFLKHCKHAIHQTTNFFWQDDILDKRKQFSTYNIKVLWKNTIVYLPMEDTVFKEILL